ncbi:hypothetical protein L915_10344, partial [Phytophthora nicotianae]
LAARAKQEFAMIKVPAQGTISAIIARKDVYLNAKEEDLQARRSRHVAFPELDTALANWVLHCQARCITIDDNLASEAQRCVAHG